MPAPFHLTRFAVASTLAVSVLCLGYTTADAATPREVKRMVVKIAADTAVPPSMALAVASVESGFRDDFESAAGTRGVMQISTAIADKHGVEASALWDAQTNIRLGLKILSNLFRNAEHDWSTALMRYAKKMPGGYKPVRFARKVLRQERRFAEEIVTRRDLERRKREVLKVAADGRYEGLKATASEAEIVWQTPAPSISSARKKVRAVRPHHGLDDFSAQLEERRLAARVELDDFSAGRISDGRLGQRNTKKRFVR